jgi:hypothetical protein
MAFHEDWFRHSGNIKVATSTVWEAEVLVLLITPQAAWHIHTKSHDERLKDSSDIKAII